LIPLPALHHHPTSLLSLGKFEQMKNMYLASKWIHFQLGQQQGILLDDFSGKGTSRESCWMILQLRATVKILLDDFAIKGREINDFMVI
jgi:hypothetical protein